MPSIYSQLSPDERISNHCNKQSCRITTNKPTRWKSPKCLMKHVNFTFLTHTKFTSECAQYTIYKFPFSSSLLYGNIENIQKIGWEWCKSDISRRVIPNSINMNEGKKEIDSYIREWYENWNFSFLSRIFIVEISNYF